MRVLVGNMQTHYFKKQNGSDAVAIASDNKNELNDFEQGNAVDRKVWIKRNDMNQEMTKAAIITVCEGLDRFEKGEWSNKAEYIKTEFNKKYGKTWHCIILLRGGFSV